MIDRRDAGLGRGLRVLNWLIAGHKGAIVGIALHKGVDGVAVGSDTGPHDPAMLILDAHRRLDALRATASRLHVGRGGVGHTQRDRPDAVAVARYVSSDRVVRVGQQRRGHDEADVATHQHPRGAVAHTGLQPGIDDRTQAEGGTVKMGRLPCIRDIELDVVDTLQIEGIGRHCRSSLMRLS